MGHRSFISPRAAGRLAVAVTGLWCIAMLVTLLAPVPAAALVHDLADMRLSSPWLVAVDVALGAGAGAMVMGSRVIRRPVPAAPGCSQERLQAVQAIVDAHGHDSLAPFIVRPDKSVEIIGDTAVAYRRLGRTLVVSADPVGPADQHAAAFARLRAACAAGGLRIVVYGAGPADLEMYRRAGMRVLCAGEEAVVDPATFTLQGRPVRKLRQSVQRVEKRGWEILTVEGRDLDSALLEEIEAVERDWRAEHPRLLGFAMSFGEHEHGARPDDLFVLARSPEGDLRAVMRFLAHRGNLSLDTMRRTGETPNGLNEALVCHALALARERGVGAVSLNYAGLAHLMHGADEGGWPARAARTVLLRVLGRFFQLERLVRFNEKFSPAWRPRYLIYESRTALPRAIVRVLQVEGYLPVRGTSRATPRRDTRQTAVEVRTGLGSQR